MSPTQHFTGETRLKRALMRAEMLTHVPIEVFILSGTTQNRLMEALSALSAQQVLLPGEAIIGVDPIHRHVALALSPEIENTVASREIQNWLTGLQEDLHMTSLENALSLAVLSLAMALGTRHPPKTRNNEIHYEARRVL